MESAKTNPTKSAQKNTAPAGFGAADIAKEVGIPSAAIVRRYLRAAQIKKPKDGWVWPDKAAAKDALEAVRRAQTGAGK